MLLGGNPLLIGSYRYAMDEKGRVFLPAKWRTGLGNTLILFPGILETGMGKCLYGMPEAAWSLMAERLSRLPITDTGAQAVKRRLYAMAAACEPDSQGRVQLPQALIKAAEITKKCVVIGTGDHVEIWSEERWEDYSEIPDDSFEEAAETLTEFLR